MSSIIVSIVLLLLTATSGGAAENCTVCHRTSVEGAHEGLACSSCHGDEGDTLGSPSSKDVRAAGCVGCHAGRDALFDHAMSTRIAEREFVHRSYGQVDPGFFEKNCNDCHVSDCLDCHGGEGHDIAPAAQEDCLDCHKSYFVGREYLGMAPREDAMRYQRGPRYQGERYLKMLPDLHAELGMDCTDCHSMKSLAAGKKASKLCVDCHEAKETVLEHRIEAHLEKMECYACHSAWAPQEYGTFYLRLGESPSRKYFRLKGEKSSEYLKSAYLKRQDAPPLGLNEEGRVSPIRPQFISYFTDVLDHEEGKEENRLLAAEWKAFFPHTVRSGTPMCDGCHDSPRRFLLEDEKERIYRTDLDGLGLNSFWDREGQKVANGAFIEAERFEKMSSKTPQYKKAYVEKWKSLVDRVEDGSKD